MGMAHAEYFPGAITLNRGLGFPCLYLRGTETLNKSQG